MRKQTKRLIVIVVILIVLCIAYILISHYFNQKEEEENAAVAVPFSVESVADVTGVDYYYEGENIHLTKKDGIWKCKGNKSVNLDDDNIDDQMISTLVRVEASRVIESPDDISEYGFETNEDGDIEPDGNIITVYQGDDESVIYIGAANAYDSTIYYMMVDGDDNVYVVDDSVAEAFSKSVDDITEVETDEDTDDVEES